MSRFIDEHRGRFGVEPICRVLGVSASAYYHRNSGARSACRVDDERLLGRIEEVHAGNYHAYGYRRTWKALLRAGEQCGRDRVTRLMRTHGIQGAKRRGKPWRTIRPDLAARWPPDLVGRDFTASRPDELWVADFTYLRCWEGVVFFSFVIDVFSRRVVGWQFASHMRTDLVLDALRMVLSRREHGADVELTHHSDAGSQYTAQAFRQVLHDHRVLASIGTVGDAYDNAIAESFVDTFKTELIRDRVWRTRAQLELAIVEYVSWFNTDRLHESLDDCPQSSRHAQGPDRFRIPLSKNEQREPPNPASAKPSPAHRALSVPAGPLGQRIVAIARQELATGIREPGNNCVPYNHCDGQPWCASFLTYVWRRAGVPIPYTEASNDIWILASQHATALPPDAQPAPGDAVLYGTGPQSTSTSVHVGIVETVRSDDRITTIEGNFGNRVRRNGPSAGARGSCARSQPIRS